MHSYKTNLKFHCYILSSAILLMDYFFVENGTAKPPLSTVDEISADILGKGSVVLTGCSDAPEILSQVELPPALEAR